MTTQRLTNAWKKKVSADLAGISDLSGRAVETQVTQRKLF